MKKLEYLNPESTQTLRQGIQELRAAEGADGDAAQNVASELINDIDVHDAIHVLFACPTNLVGEISAHVWTLFGTTMRVRDMQRVNSHDDHRSVIAEIGHWRLLRTWLRSFPRICATIFQSLRMKRRWPADDYRSFLDRRLCDLRKDFGIRLSPIPTRESRRPGAALRSIRSQGAPHHA